MFLFLNMATCTVTVSVVGRCCHPGLMGSTGYCKLLMMPLNIQSLKDFGLGRPSSRRSTTERGSPV